MDSKPDILSDTAYVLSVQNELANFGGNLLDYCEFYGVKSLDERNLLSMSLSILRQASNNTGDK